MTDPRRMHAPSGFHEDRPLRRADLLPDPIEQFGRWLADADRAGVPLPNAMALATADADGRPSVRHVLLRGLDDRGFVFNTNRESRKGRELESNPHAGLVFLWKQLDRQVCVDGKVVRTADEDDDAYFATRPARCAARRLGIAAIRVDRRPRRARCPAGGGDGPVRRRRRPPAAVLGRLPRDPALDRVLAGTPASAARPLPVPAGRRRRVADRTAVAVGPARAGRSAVTSDRASRSMAP